MDCTDGTPDEHGEKSDWHERKINYLKHLHSISEDAILVVAADKLHNVRSITQDLQTLGESVFERFTTKKEGTLWYYRSVADILYQRCACPITKILHHTVTEMEKLTNIDKTF
jgi:(p)ppGpp synthase/HD superfamily hydrolase